MEAKKLETKIDELVKQMTLDEKIAMLAGADLWHSVPIERLGIPAMRVTDGPNGARGSGGSSGPASACFPVGSALGATWNPELVERVGAALGEETSAKGAQILLAPTVNIHRSPLAGRNFECYSEDPYLTSRMAVAYIKGLQSQGVGACIKHFVCNDSEFERHTMSSEVRERALREIYLPPFRAALSEAQPWAVMSAYNKLNGVWCSENKHLLLDILKSEWGFDGIVISDWWGTYSPNVPAGGVDLEMPGPARWMTAEHVRAALDQGEVSEADLDDRVRRLLRTLARAGLFENPELQPEQAIDKPEHREVARQAAGEAIVLLKNQGDILPLDGTKINSIAVIGENARWAQVMGGGSSEVTPHYVVSPLDGITQRAGEAMEVAYEIGCPIHMALPLMDLDWIRVEDSGHRGLRLEVFDNLDLSGEPVEVRDVDRMRLAWIDEIVGKADPRRFSARLKGCFTPPETSEYQFSLRGNGIYRMFLNGELLIDRWADKILDVPPWGSMEKVASIDLVAGREYWLEIEYAWEGNTQNRELRLGCWPQHSGDLMEAAVALANRSDVVIVVAGLTKEWETEGSDRVNMDLPGEQNALIERIAAANPNTVVVLNAGSPLHMPWLDKVAAVLQSWYLGQETGNALADVLFGDVNPSGKLPTTFPKRYQDNPAYVNYPGENGKVYYGEGIFVGYRYYEAKQVEPLFPFGHGLSYTQFEYRDLEIKVGDSDKGREIQVSLQVENIGKRFGHEVVQCYLRDIHASLARPIKELKAFAKVALEPGEVQQVNFSLDQQALAFYDDAQKSWVTEPGIFEVLLGNSSADIRLRGQFEWLGDGDKGGGRFHEGLPLETLLADERSKAVLRKHLGDLLDHSGLEMGMRMSLVQLAEFAPVALGPEVLAAIGADLAAIER
jgi:beta-glucosidase